MVVYSPSNLLAFAIHINHSCWNTLVVAKTVVHGDKPFTILMDGGSKPLTILSEWK